jgi:hypothetical protein
MGIQRCTREIREMELEVEYGVKNQEKGNMREYNGN